jgi:hypothetical protein
MAYLTFKELGRYGRLGNQLFQIAGTIGLALRHQMEPRFPTNWDYREWFSIPDELFADAEGVTAYYMPELDHLRPENRPFLQQFSLWEGQADLIRQYFAPSPAASKALATDELDDQPRVALHVRRGDYLLAPEAHPVPPLEYYLNAVAEYPHHVIEVYSDDLEWCWNNLLPALEPRPAFLYPGTARPPFWDPAYFTSPIVDWIDLFLMARCERHIIANSSFSWWGAFLSGNTEVIYPATWYGPAYSHLDVDAMMPPGWRSR